MATAPASAAGSGSQCLSARSHLNPGSLGSMMVWKGAEPTYSKVRLGVSGAMMKSIDAHVRTIYFNLTLSGHQLKEVPWHCHGHRGPPGLPQLLLPPEPPLPGGVQLVYGAGAGAAHHQHRAVEGDA